MIKINDFIKEFEIVKKTDRDCEIPLLMEYLQSISPIDSLLDVGAHWSVYNEYADKIRPLAKTYDGVDISLDPEVALVVDTFYIGNVCDIKLPKYNTVICVSTIEHAGVSTYKVEDVKKEQERLFMRCLELANKSVWISFPVGQEYVYPNELSIITEKQLKRFETLTSNFKVKERFFYNQGAQAGHPWYEHTSRAAALSVPYMDFIGTQSICVMEITK